MIKEALSRAQNRTVKTVSSVRVGQGVINQIGVAWEVKRDIRARHHEPEQYVGQSSLRLTGA